MKQINESAIDQVIADVQKMFADKAERDKQRQTCNLEIVEFLKEFFLAYPYMRFEQAIYVLLNGELDFSRESVDTLKKIQDFKQRNKNNFKTK
jgi:hypothetical protein